MREYIRYWLHAPLDALMNKADEVRREYKGDEVYIRALLETSNICHRNCAYCGLTVGNTGLTRYEMGASEIVSRARRAFDVGYQTIVLQSGENADIDIGKYADIISQISDFGMTVTLSFGELSSRDYQRLYEAGARRYLLKHETASREVYARLHDGYTLDERLEHAHVIKDIGYEYGGGFLVGLNDRDDDMEDDLLLLHELACDMVGIGRFVPHSATALRDRRAGDVEKTLRAVAIARLILPQANIPVTTSLSEGLGGYGAFEGGANVIMVRVTDAQYGKLYDIYPSSKCAADITIDRENVERQIRAMGRRPI